MRLLKPLALYPTGIGLFALLIASGCGKSSPTGPNGVIPTLSLRQALNAALPAIVPVPANLDTTASVLVTLHVPGGLKGAGAAFLNNGSLVSAGNVWIRTFTGGALDSVQLAQTVAGAGTLIIYSTLTGAPPPVVNIPFDGNAYHVFRVSGSTAIPAFVDSAKSVDDLNLASPLADTTITRSTGLTVSWSDGGSDPTVKVAVTVIANSDSTLKASAALALDSDGSAQVSAAALGHLPPGGARLSVARYRLVYKVAGGRNTGFGCETVEVKNLTLN
jgi:hypothetical protein